jgi:hypothetical protein
MKIRTLAWATTAATAILGCAWLSATVHSPMPHDAWMTPGQTGVTNIVVFAVWALVFRAAWFLGSVLELLAIFLWAMATPYRPRVTVRHEPLTGDQSWDARDEERWARHAGMMRGTN